MKKCPQCNRTYADDTLSFCLEDGGLLSAAYDSDRTLVLASDDPTIHSTKSVYDSGKSTVTVIHEPNQTSSTIGEIKDVKTSPHLIYAVAGLIAVLMIVGGFVWLNSSNRSQVDTIQSRNENSNSTVADKVVMPERTPNTPAAIFHWMQKDEPEPGRRTWYQLDSVTWIEQYPSGFRESHKVIDRTNIGGIEGVITQKVSGDPKNPVYEKTFEVFIPDKHSGSTSLFYRRFINGSWQNWNKLAELTWDAPSLTNENNNVPSVRQMQQDIDKEIKKMVDEANR